MISDFCCVGCIDRFWVLTSSLHTDGQANVTETHPKAIFKGTMCKMKWNLSFAFVSSLLSFIHIHLLHTLFYCLWYVINFQMGLSWVFEERRWVFDCWYLGIRCKDTAGITSADHLTVKKRLIAAGKQMSMCQPSGKVTQNTVHPLCWDNGVILLYEKTCSPFSTADEAESCSSFLVRYNKFGL